MPIGDIGLIDHNCDKLDWINGQILGLPSRCRSGCSVDLWRCEQRAVQPDRLQLLDLRSERNLQLPAFPFTQEQRWVPCRFFYEPSQGRPSCTLQDQRMEQHRVDTAHPGQRDDERACASVRELDPYQLTGDLPAR